jgi:hypothetical protein
LKLKVHSYSIISPCILWNYEIRPW